MTGACANLYSILPCFIREKLDVSNLTVLEKDIVASITFT